MLKKWQYLIIFIVASAVLNVPEAFFAGQNIKAGPEKDAIQVLQNDSLNADKRSEALNGGSWPVARHDIHNTGRSPNPGPTTSNGKWTYHTHGLIEGAPSIAQDGTIYVTSQDGNVYSFHPDGALNWIFPTLDVIRGTPAIADDGTIYIGSFDGCLYAIKNDGSLNWCYYTGEMISSSPTIGTDGTIYVGIHTGEVIAVNPDGTLQWSYSTNCTIAASSPAIGLDGTVFIGAYCVPAPDYIGGVFAINPDGSLKWTYATTGNIRTAPSLSSDGSTLYIGTRGGILYALNTSDGSLTWEFITGDQIRASTALASDGTIYVGSYDHYLYAVNPDGTEKWKFLTDGPIETSPAIDSLGVVYTGAWGGHYYFINSDGTLKEKVLLGIYYTSPAIGADNTLYGGFDFWIRAIGPPSPPTPCNPCKPLIDVSSNKNHYSTGDTINITVDLTYPTDFNPGEPDITIQIKGWITLPGGAKIPLNGLPDIMTISPGDSYSKTVLTYAFTGSQPQGAYMIGGRIINPVTGDLMDHDFKTITFVP